MEGMVVILQKVGARPRVWLPPGAWGISKHAGIYFFGCFLSRAGTVVLPLKKRSCVVKRWKGER